MTTLADHRAAHPDPEDMSNRDVDVELALRMGWHYELRNDIGRWINGAKQTLYTEGEGMYSDWSPTEDHAQNAKVRSACAKEIGRPVIVTTVYDGTFTAVVFGYSISNCPDDSETEASSRACFIAWRRFDEGREK